MLLDKQLQPLDYDTTIWLVGCSHSTMSTGRDLVVVDHSQLQPLTTSDQTVCFHYNSTLLMMRLDGK